MLLSTTAKWLGMQDSRNEVVAKVAALRVELEQETARLAEAAERWLDAKAGKRKTESIEAELSAIQQETRRIERRIQRQEKKLRRSQHGNQHQAR